jgi:hypothetical protein
MKWLNAFLAALKRLTHYGTPASTVSYNMASADGCHSALPTSGKPTPDVTPQSMSPEMIIHMRAIRLYNRSQKGAGQYVKIHTILNRGN